MAARPKKTRNELEYESNHNKKSEMKEKMRKHNEELKKTIKSNVRKNRGKIKVGTGKY